MIHLEHLSKTFESKDRSVKAVQDVNLDIHKGEIFGIIGYSGAGKSTLVRCINLLEKPTSGKVIVNGKDLMSLSPKELRSERKNIGMIFQQFNLLSSLNVKENVLFNLKGQSLSKEQMDQRVDELLDIVGISDKKDAYPSQLSGGQKQRVAIARAIANHPDILLCDEATSALDPQTTNAILKLLKDLNEKLGITVVIITHEMAIVKEICDRIAIMENGEVKECDTVFEVFSNPKSNIAKEFIKTTSGIHHVEELLAANKDKFKLSEDDRIVRIDFKGEATRESVISILSRDYNVDFNIIYGDVDSIAGQIIGTLVVILSTTSKNFDEVQQALREKNIRVEELDYGTIK